MCGPSGCTIFFHISHKSLDIQTKKKGYSTYNVCLTLILLMWRIGWAPNNASKWQMEFKFAFKGLIFLDPCVAVWISRNTNKMRPCNRIYYYKVYWRLNMFRAAHRSSSGALNYLQPGLYIYIYIYIYIHTHVVTGRCQGWGCKYSLELLMMSGMPLETCWASSKLWNNKFYYKVASCWLFLLSVLIFSTSFVWKVSHSEKNRARYYHKRVPHITINVFHVAVILVGF